MSHLKTLAAASLLAITTAAHAADAPASRLSLDLNLASVHTEAWARRELNQVNPGLGLEYQASPDWGAAVGFYRNSYRRTSAYALGVWTPMRLDLPGGLTASAGLAAGLVSGYHRSEVPCEPLAAGAVLRLRTAQGFGINLLAVPNTQSGSGFIGLQLVAPI
ncbi:hypothetical protein [Thiomonas arsenitoxydans]|uniref:Uncharacterized protein n=1 Tax=Thiomonas arsenitoxydans (strain DSM 22701 / CIP 110005 / 3As) TaxID=426114 RepID=D6CTU9_THIA3|nr:hypothetical protein [Thiomonas arsenitoxydans]CAZ88718.1 conserved hypothetical protein; putative exported protein [Thiomonas arsenitoxydans]